MSKFKNLKDGEFYWVKFFEKDKMEIAKYREKDNQFCFTNGSRCEPERMFFVDTRQIDYEQMPEGLVS